MLAAARDALVALAHHPREQGAGVSVTRYWKASNVAYAKIPALQGLDLSGYRGKTREEVRVMTAAWIRQSGALSIVLCRAWQHGPKRVLLAAWWLHDP